MVGAARHVFPGPPSDLQLDLPAARRGGAVSGRRDGRRRGVVPAEGVQGQQQRRGVPLQPLEGPHHGRGSSHQGFVAQQRV